MQRNSPYSVREPSDDSSCENPVQPHQFVQKPHTLAYLQTSVKS